MLMEFCPETLEAHVNSWDYPAPWEVLFDFASDLGTVVPKERGMEKEGNGDWRGKRWEEGIHCSIVLFFGFV